MKAEYEKNGYFVVKNLFSENELFELRQCLLRFHQAWQQDNLTFYATKAVNSAYITGTRYLNDNDRQKVFAVIGGAKIMGVLHHVMPAGAAFMNTQLFFNPANKTQKNYWHRDSQYHLSMAEQQAALNGPEVLHFRLPLADEPGIELVPRSHRQWDSQETLDIRLAQNGKLNSEAISTGIKIPLQAGDLMVFSANMIHRGLYGMERFALDLLFCEPDPQLLKFVEQDCLPNKELMVTIEDASAFIWHRSNSTI